MNNIRFYSCAKSVRNRKCGCRWPDDIVVSNFTTGMTLMLAKYADAHIMIVDSLRRKKYSPRPVAPCDNTLLSRRPSR